jgi:hypothetical protein
MPSLRRRVVDATGASLRANQSTQQRRERSRRALAEAAASAVVASVRYEDTDYDALLMAGVPRDEARARVRAAVDTVLDRWRS